MHLRKHQELEHVRVEDVWKFSLGKDAAVASQNPTTTVGIGVSTALDNANTRNTSAGEACYITATVQNRRYYGLLVERQALTQASALYWQEQSAGLELNRRMLALQQAALQTSQRDTLPRQAELPPPMKQPRLEAPPVARPTPHNPPNPPVSASNQTANNMIPEITDTDHRPVQKFTYDAERDVRTLWATYANIAAAATEQANAADIRQACDSGGGFVGPNYYYQYEPPKRSLQLMGAIASPEGMNTTLGLDTFLKNTPCPPWYPLSNASGQQQIAMESLGLKRKDYSATPSTLSQMNSLPTLPPMDQVRSRYHIIILGAGISGLATALELFRQTERLGIPIQITLVEGRARIGGRLWTDRDTFVQTTSRSDAPSVTEPFPVDLGAGWIHGINMNPLADLARQVGVDFVTASEEVTMLDAGHAVHIDAEKDDRAGKIFDQLLDLAVEDCWKSSGISTTAKDYEPDAKVQSAVRWYGSILRPPSEGADDWPTEPVRETPAPHRVSSDISVDQAIGKVIRDIRTSQMANMHDQEKRMLRWNLKNVEYALGANVRDLSMRYWDIDERHAFEGDHVLLRQGYSTVIDYMLRELQKHGDHFELVLEAPVVKVEYARKTATIPLISTQSMASMIELSDTCKVTTKSSERPEICGDFVVCSLPLGVLKESVSKNTNDGIVFDPPLPFPKQDAIESVGFGLLNKIYIQFPTAFWRLPGIVDEDTAQFGNASSHNPHFYMFFDMGKIMATDNHVDENTPAILLTLVSGHEAVLCEQLDEHELLGDVLGTLRNLFQGTELPEPTAYQITQWGSDEFSRGSYTYLAPGCTDQDFLMLQSPINGNGDSTLLETAETYRVFFAGEHTTALHPSMAHGALLSGYRAANEVISNMAHSRQPALDVERTIPLSLFRHQFPDAKLVCALCGVADSTIREGSLLAFKRGPRAVLVHSHCAEFSPEVEIVEGVWKNVFQACSRGRELECYLCGKRGATIECSGDRCQRYFHYCCAEDTGFRFDKDSGGKLFACDMHRRGMISGKESRRISVSYFESTNFENIPLACGLCGMDTKCQLTGELLAFQQGDRKRLFHHKCLKYSNVVALSADLGGRIMHDYSNVFSLLDFSKYCHRCRKQGATVGCVHPSCDNCYHYPCATGLNWNFEKSLHFKCPLHRQTRPLVVPKNEDSVSLNPIASHGLFQHALFTQETGAAQDSGPANQDVGAPDLDMPKSNDDDSLSEFGSEMSQETSDLNPIQEPLSNMQKLLNHSRFVGMERGSISAPWNLSLSISKEKLRDLRYIAFASDYHSSTGDTISRGEILVAINGNKVGSPLLHTMEDVLTLLRQEVELLVEIQSALPDSDL